MRSMQAWNAGKSFVSIFFAILLSACGGGNKGYLYYTAGDDVIRHDLRTGMNTSHIKTRFLENDGVSVSDDASIFAVFGEEQSGDQQTVDFYDSSSNLIYQVSNPLYYYHLPIAVSPDNQCFLIYWTSRVDDVRDLDIYDFDGNISGVPYPKPEAPPAIRSFNSWDWVSNDEIIYSAIEDDYISVSRVALNPDCTAKGKPQRIMQQAVSNLSVSPGGTKVAYTHSDTPSGESSAIYIMNIDGTGIRKVAEGNFNYSSGTDDAFTSLDWSPDGKSLVFTTLGPKLNGSDERACSIVATIPTNKSTVIDVYDPQYWVVEQVGDSLEYICRMPIGPVSWRAK